METKSNWKLTLFVWDNRSDSRVSFHWCLFGPIQEHEISTSTFTISNMWFLLFKKKKEKKERTMPWRCDRQRNTQRFRTDPNSRLYFVKRFHSVLVCTELLRSVLGKAIRFYLYQGPVLYPLWAVHTQKLKFQHISRLSTHWWMCFPA